MSDSTQIWLGAFSMIATVWGAYMTYLQVKIQAEQNRNGKKVDNLAEISTNIHLNQKKMGMDIHNRLAEITQDGVDISSAKVAKRDFLDACQGFPVNRPGTSEENNK